MIENRMTQTYFDHVAPSWLNNEAEKRDKLFSILARLKLANAHSILDLGCGTGILFPLLYKLTEKKANIFAIDFSQGMTRLAAASTVSTIHITCGDAQFLPFAENTFDRIVAFQMFPHVHQKRLALQECWHVLQPGGEFAIIHLHSSEELESIHAHASSTVKNHRLSPANVMATLLQETNYAVLTAIDQPGQYVVHAIKLR